MTRTIDDLPGPPRLPILGNAHQVIRTSRVHATVENWCRRYGPIYRVDVARRRVVVVEDADAINVILRDRPGGFGRWRDQQVVFDEMGVSGVFTAEGDDWKRLRRLVIAGLNTKHLHRSFRVIHTATERLHRRLSQAAESGVTLDIEEELSSYSVDIISALAFGHDVNTLERRDNELQAHLLRTFEMIARRLGAPVPYWRWVRLPADRALERSLSAIHSTSETFIEQTRARLASTPELREAPENFLEAMVAAQEAGGAFTDDEIIGNTSCSFSVERTRRRTRWRGRCGSSHQGRTCKRDWLTRHARSSARIGSPSTTKRPSACTWQRPWSGSRSASSP